MFHYLMKAHTKLPQRHEQGNVTSPPLLTLTRRFAFSATVTVRQQAREHCDQAPAHITFPLATVVRFSNFDEGPAKSNWPWDCPFLRHSITEKFDTKCHMCG